jgi:hypothetical protein
MLRDGLLFAQALRKLLKIKAGRGQQIGSGASHFFYDRINPRNLYSLLISQGPLPSPMSSSGVQSAGASYPSARHARSIRGRNSAFAI